MPHQNPSQLSDNGLSTEISPEDLTAEQLAAIRERLGAIDALDDLGDEQHPFAVDFD